MIILRILSFVLIFVFLASFSIEIKANSNKVPKIEFTSNPVHGLYNFVQGLSGGPGASSRTLIEIYNNADIEKSLLEEQLNRFRLVNLSYDYAFSEEVTHRHNKRQITELLVMASTQAKDIDDFAQRIMGVLTNADLMVVIETLKIFEPVYQELIWQPAQERFQKDLVDLNKRASEVDFAQRFIKASKLYNADWKADLPFKVYFAPIPADSGYTTATPQGNIISYITAYIRDHDAILSVVFHELAHLLYANQPIEFQKEIERAFLDGDSYYKAHAYQLFNEAMATSVGNGWFYKETNGLLDEKDWYFSPFINQQAKSIYPMVESYLANGKSIDNAFVDSYIKTYAQNFPKGYLEPDSFLANVNFLADRDFKDHNKLFQLFFQTQGSVRSLNVQTPFFEKEAMDKFNSAINAKMIVLTEDAQENLKKFEEYYPWFGQIQFPNSEFIMHALLNDGTMLMIVNIDTIDNLPKAIKALKANKVLKKGVNVITI